MPPSKPLPYPDEWASTEEYVDNLLKFVTTSDTFRILCGGVHLLDFYTTEPGLFTAAVPEDWQPWLKQCDPLRLIDILMREDLETLPDVPPPPEGLLEYIKNIRKFSLVRDYAADTKSLPRLTWSASVGMKPKKVHEVTNFANYVDRLAKDIGTEYDNEITHFVDFGSGQNYLGRALASAPYNKQIVAVEGREHNIAGAKALDIIARTVERPVVIRNKKLYMQSLDSKKSGNELDEKAVDRAQKRAAKPSKTSEIYVPDLTPRDVHQVVYKPEEGKGFIQYVEGRLESGDLTDVVGQLKNSDDDTAKSKDLRLMAISIHSCGNLSHHGIRSLLLNPDVQAIAIVGCCYNLMTEKLGPPTYKLPYMRPSLQAINGRVVKESEKRDPHGFPMSDRLSTYDNGGIRLNITARMMACQAPRNWTEVESDSFFTRHFFRAVLQKICLDRGVISKVYHDQDPADDISEGPSKSPFNTSTNPVIIGSLRKSCYGSFTAYVRGAIEKLTTNSDYHEYREIIKERLADITDGEIAEYESKYTPRKRELSAIWTLMAFSAVVVESLIATDRWLFLRQQNEVHDCWVETVFDYKQSPRNLVVVGVKKPVSTS
ncbi:methyltransferase domain-containing protein [Xylariaceae sp. FL1272]|nr:methyltransferase domain-containing protein [Xylariaceae sp. FL1272]